MQILVQQAVGGAWEYAFLTSSQVVLCSWSTYLPLRNK